MIWQDGIDSTSIAETIDQHTFLITFVRGERKNQVKREDTAIRVYLCFLMVQGYLALVEAWGKLEKPVEAKNCYEKSRLIGEKGIQLRDKKMAKVQTLIKFQEDEEGKNRLKSSLKSNFQNMKQAYDLDYLTDSQIKDRANFETDDEINPYTIVELREVESGNEYMYQYEKNLEFDYEEIFEDKDVEEEFSYELLPTKEDILFQRYYKFGGLKFKLIVADAKIYPGIIIYLYNAPYQILRNFILHYKDCADFVPIHS